MPVPNSDLMGSGEHPYELRLAELESRLAFQELSLTQLSDALAEARAESARNHQLLQRALEDLKTLRTLLYSDPTSEPPPPHY